MLNDDSILYHYCSVDVFVNILKTHSIWLTHAREMNDFHEDILFRKPLKTALQSFVNRSEPERQLLQQIVDEYTKRADFPYVACFSRDKDMLSQWRAYADNGKGLLRALAGYSYYRYGGNWYTDLWNALTKLYKTKMAQA